MKPQIKLIFWGIDFWSRPIYKHWLRELYFGSIEKLCGTVEEVQNRITSSDISFFGSDPEDDPLGSILAVDYILEY